MNKDKQFDCVKFKNELQENVYKNCGAANLQEYAFYANETALKSSLYKENTKAGHVGVSDHY